jgi:hypothetical protein
VRQSTYVSKGPWLEHLALLCDDVGSCGAVVQRTLRVCHDLKAFSVLSVETLTGLPSGYVSALGNCRTTVAVICRSASAYSCCFRAERTLVCLGLMFNSSQLT